jgi:hypothetical protein
LAQLLFFIFLKLEFQSFFLRLLISDSLFRFCSFFFSSLPYRFLLFNLLKSSFFLVLGLSLSLKLFLLKSVTFSFFSLLSLNALKLFSSLPFLSLSLLLLGS